MSSGDFTDSGLWCRMQTEQPVARGTVQTASIVGVRTNGPSGRTHSELPATGARGREIVAWRGIDGVLQLSEARCPHQFVHLASSGTVDGCELVCTAHFWRFGATGEGSIRDSSGHREPVSALIVFPNTESEGEIWGYIPSHFVVVDDQ
jgi:nitrite reductase/ring-hydroxylating ferredoxin subunit